jgi:predicted transcriptional regulator of viral defense system
MKKYLEEFHKLKVFGKQEATDITKDANTAKDLLRRYKQEGFLSQVRRNLYVATDLVTKSSIATQFEIGSQVTPSAYIAYHSALEYHGLSNQQFYEVYVSSKERFNDFDYEGLHYRCCESRLSAGILTPIGNSLVKVTDLERTVVDCLDYIDRAGGLEELVVCLTLITYLKEDKLLEYLAGYDKQVLYQKVGFVLSYFQTEMQLSDVFFSICKDKTGKSTRYLTDAAESTTFFKEWNLYAPADILSSIKQGTTDYAELY